jgi:hypothetical protein
MMVFDNIEPGIVLGQSEFRVTDAAVSEWTSLFPSDATGLPVMPRAMISMISMRAFMEIVHDRPKGNVHAEQSTVLSALPSIGDTLMTRLRCLEKVLKNGRRWITFETDTVDSRGKALFRGQMKILWAA